MILESLATSILTIPFKVAFKHHSAERHATQALWVVARAHGGVVGHGEGCPREYVTAETLQSAQRFVAIHLPNLLQTVRDLETLADWVAGHAADIDSNPAAWTAVELALLDAIGKDTGRSVESLLGVPELAGRFQYSAVLGDAAPRQFEAQLAQYLQGGFRAFKIKLSGNRDRDLTKVRALTASNIAAQAVRADANNLWEDDQAACAYLRALEFRFGALEEPLRTGDVTGMRRLAAALDTRIILDESLLRAEQIEAFAADPQRWILNVRISKMGGLLRSLELCRSARARNLDIVIGAHVGETSLLTRAALTLAHSARSHLLAQEGAFGTHLLAHDVVEPPLMFAAGGLLDADALGLRSRSGFGLEVLAEGVGSRE